MKKSEMVRAAAEQVRTHGENRRVCYCTPSRAMLRSVNAVCLNQNLPRQEAQQIANEMGEAIGAQLRRMTGVDAPMRTFDTEDTNAAYALTDRIVRDAFEETAKQYEAAEIAAWDAAKAAWEASVRAAETPVRHEVAPPVDPAQQRSKAPKAKAKATKKVTG